MDLSIRPCDDFWRYANGTWLRDTTIPADKPVWGGFSELRDRNVAILREILESASAGGECSVADPQTKSGVMLRRAMSASLSASEGAGPPRSAASSTLASRPMSLGVFRNRPGRANTYRTAISMSS